MKKLLSILIISLPERHALLQKLYDQLALQTNNRNDVEILVLTDNRSLSVGRKRQFLNMMASGEYIVHVDDDDRVSTEFVSLLLDAIHNNQGVDVITFIVNVSIDKGSSKPCLYSSFFHQNMNFDDHYQRLPNTRCCFRKTIAIREEIADMIFGEDDEWGARIKPHIKTEHSIPKPLYFYDASTQKPNEWFSTV